MLRMLLRAKPSDVIFNITKDELSKFKPQVAKPTDSILLKDITAPKAPEAPKYTAVTQSELDKYDPK